MQLLNKHRHGSPADAKYIGRGSPVGNPYVIGKDGTRLEVIALYRTWLEQKILEKDPKVTQFMLMLKSDSMLLCFCSPLPCHGSVIEEHWRKYFDDSKDTIAVL
jgi:hypothetical protein